MNFVLSSLSEGLVFLVRLLDYIVLEVLSIVKNLGFFQKQHLRL